MADFPKNIKIEVNEQSYWKGLGRQEMSFHHVIGELIDNCISASGVDIDGDKKPFKIEILIEKRSEKIIIDIVDYGIGISENELIQQIFSPGGRGKSNGELNEHGFGLKNSLCVLTEGNKLKWTIITRDKEALDNGIVYKVCGPFSSNMKLDVSKGEELNRKDSYNVQGTGTRIHVETSFDYFSTVYNRARKFDTLIERLIEHLGVMYKKYLNSNHNKLYIKWKNTQDTSSSWKTFRVEPIEIPYDIDGSKEYSIELEGSEGPVEVKYVVGKLDYSKTQVIPEGERLPYPLKIYYQGNQQTQGVDFVVRGRVIKSGVLKEIWGIAPHNIMNKFVGEVIADDSKIKTVNNKIGLDPNNEYTIKLLDSLRSEERFKIEKVTNSKTEKNLKEKFKSQLKGIFTGSTVQSERPIWSGCGVKVDVFLQESNKEMTVYEFKAGTAAPLDVYQLLMYWDGVAKDENRSPKLGRLVAKEIPQSVKNIAEEINKRADSMGNRYNLECKTIKDMGL